MQLLHESICANRGGSVAMHPIHESLSACMI